MDCEGPCKPCRGGSPPFSLLLLEVSVRASDPEVRARGGVVGVWPPLNLFISHSPLSSD